MEENPARKKTWAFGILAVSLSAVLALGFLELIFWYRLHEAWPRGQSLPGIDFRTHTEMGRRLKPDQDVTMVAGLSGQIVRIRTNSFGFRGGEVSEIKTPGTTRILVLGDSITGSFYLNEDKIYPTLLGEELSLIQPVEVVNAAVWDSGLKDEIGVLKKNGLKLNPDIVLIGFYLNDSRPPWGFEGEYLSLSPRLVEVSKTVEGYSYLYKWIWRRFLVTRFLTRNEHARMRWRHAYTSGEWKTDRDAYRSLVEQASWDWGAAWKDDTWDTIFSGFEEVLGLSEKHGLKTAVVLFPVRVQVEAEYFDDYPQETLKSFCDAKGIPCLDLLPLFRDIKDEAIYFDHCHLNERGHEKAAEAIAGFIEKDVFPELKMRSR